MVDRSPELYTAPVRRIAVGTVLIVCLALFLFWRIDRWAGVMMFPYIAWVSFATLLNASLWVLNAG